MYSEDFVKLIEKSEKVKKLLEGSGMKSSNFEDWEQSRKFIADTIDMAGSILDVGCGNGFLLRSLQEWSQHELIPYGIDQKQNLIEECKNLFPHLTDHFKPLNLFKKEFLFRWMYGLPKTYDFIYWNVWDDFNFEKRGLKEIEHLTKSLNNHGTLMLGFYEKDKDKKSSKISFLRNSGYSLNTNKNPNGHEWLAFLKQN